MGILISGTTNDILVNGVSVATDAEVSTAVTANNTAYVDAQIATRGRLVQGTAVNSTSGTSIDFTGIPSWAKKITVMFNGVSTSGSSNLLIQIGSGSIQTTGYLASTVISYSMNTPVSTTATNGFITFNNNGSYVFYGSIDIKNISNNNWVSNHCLGSYATAIGSVTGGGSVTLGGILDRVRITTVNGTDTFDAGSINIMYEG